MAMKCRKGLSMRKMREILRLGLKCGLGNRDIARSCCISHPTVKKYLSSARKEQLTYEQAENMDDNALYILLRGKSSFKPRTIKPMPNCAYIHEELKRKGVTLQLLWQEYKDVHPDGYQSSQFCEYYYRWKKKLNISMRQTHKAGEKMFVDYAGQTVPIYSRETDVITPAQVFIAVLGASNYTYSEAQEDQSLPNWIHGHTKAFEYFKGVTKAIVPDNLKTGIQKACRYEPDINPTYHELAKYYGTVVMPARVNSPKDKAKVESGVLLVERWILAALRNRKFFSIQELNMAIRDFLVRLNDRPFKKLPGSRRSTYEAIEKNALMPLPDAPYEYAEWKKARVNIDYHVELNCHYYSVPYNLVHETVEMRYTNTIVEIYFKGNRIASHLRSSIKGSHTTVKEHMPESHRQYLEWTPSRIINWAKKAGEETARVVEIILQRREYPEQGYRSCLGIMRLGKAYSDKRLELACKRALAYKACSYKTVKTILEKGLDKEALPDIHKSIEINHDNLRGKEYFELQTIKKEEVPVC